MIIQFGIPRSGTTVVWQILNELFPNEVIKTHSVKKYDCKSVLTIRDFRDILISQFMTDREKNGKMQSLDLGNKCFKSKEISMPIFSKIIINKYVKRIIKEEKFLQEYINFYKDNCICLKYEKFFENFEYIFENLENFFNIDINKKTKVAIINKYKLESNKKISDRLEDFNQWDSNSLIHGHHIINGTPGNWKNIIPKKLHGYLNRNLSKILRRWEYIS